MRARNGLIMSSSIPTCIFFILPPPHLSPPPHPHSRPPPAGITDRSKHTLFNTHSSNSQRDFFLFSFPRPGGGGGEGVGEKGSEGERRGKRKDRGKNFKLYISWKLGWNWAFAERTFRVLGGGLFNLFQEERKRSSEPPPPPPFSFPKISDRNFRRGVKEGDCLVFCLFEILGI